MTRRLAASMAFVAFVVCILAGLQAGNPFASVVGKSLVALFATFFVGLVIGTMAQKMLDENLAAAQPKKQNFADSGLESEAADR